MFFFSTNAKLLSINEMYKCTAEITSHKHRLQVIENFWNSIPCTVYHSYFIKHVDSHPY